MKSNLKKINVEVTENEVKNLTRVLIDVLEFYSTLPNRKEKMKMLVETTQISNKLTKAYFNYK